jgi:hypothetical protein
MNTYGTPEADSINGFEGDDLIFEENIPSRVY